MSLRSSPSYAFSANEKPRAKVNRPMRDVGIPANRWYNHKTESHSWLLAFAHVLIEGIKQYLKQYLQYLVYDGCTSVFESDICDHTLS